MAYNIQRYVPTTDLAIVVGQTAGSITTPYLNGKIVGIMANVPNVSGSSTVTIAITDADGYTVYSKATIAENAKFSAFIDANNQPLQLPVAGALTITVTSTTQQATADSAVPMVLLIDRG